ncbi:unnamed protein product, partial [Mesorhabditis spiculigera]
MGFFDTIVPKPPLPDDSLPGGRYTHRLAPHTADAQPTFATSSLFGDNVKRISSSPHRAACQYLFQAAAMEQSNGQGFASNISRRVRLSTTSWR